MRAAESANYQDYIQYTRTGNRCNSQHNNGGKVIMTLVKLIIIISVAFLKYPDIDPRKTPIRVEIAAAVIPTRRETLPP